MAPTAPPFCLSATTTCVCSHTGSVMVTMTVETDRMRSSTFAVRKQISTYTQTDDSRDSGGPKQKSKPGPSNHSPRPPPSTYLQRVSVQAKLLFWIVQNKVHTTLDVATGMFHERSKRWKVKELFQIINYISIVIIKNVYIWTSYTE